MRPPSISADGRYVAFQSGATNLVTGDTNASDDVFVRDTVAGTTTRVSVASDGSQGDSSSDYPSVSADGRYVAFSTRASNLVPNDTNGKDDVFLHDNETGETTCVSVASDGSQANGYSESSALSADGRYVAFDSQAKNLVPGDTNGRLDVFLHDTQTGTTTRVSVAGDGSEGDGHSFSPATSADGRYVAFRSNATNLVSGDTNGKDDVFLHDNETGETTRVSVASDGSQANDDSLSPATCADGRYVAFQSDATNLVSGDTNGKDDVFLHDTETGETTRVSVASDGTPGDSGCYDPALSADGRYVAFGSMARNLVPDDTNDRNDIFVHDTQTGTTTRVSVAGDGSEGDGASRGPALSADGRYVAFRSYAANLVAGDSNDAPDIFLRNLLPTELSSVEVAGPTRYETAIAASQEAFPKGADTVVIATGENWPDALGGAALAGAYDCPILLTLTSVLPDAVVNELGRLGADDAIILGGEGAVAPGVATALTTTLGEGHVTRLGGPDRYATADLIARAVEDRVGDAYDGTCFVATGSNFPDALAGSPLAAAGPWPILLAPATGMTPASLATMDDIGATDVLVLGGTGVVSQAIEDGLAAHVTGDVTRLAGPTRYETAVAVATHGVEDAFLRWNEVALATGENFPDALAGGPLQGRSGSVMLLTHTATLTPSTSTALDEHKDAIATVRFLGGAGAVSQAVRDQVSQVLE
jgi:Tol biopolymer transport system component/putative cell wall-binding protein